MAWQSKPWQKSSGWGGGKGWQQQGWQKGGGKGWQDGKGWKQQQQEGGGAKIETVPADFEVDGEARYSGTVTGFWKFKGYGFITLDQKGVVPGDKIFGYWRNIQTNDRFPTLMKDMQVEFGIQKWKTPEGMSLRAKTITLPGGGQVALQESNDARNKTFVGGTPSCAGQFARYSGKLKFFSPRNGFGYIAIDATPALSEEISKKELRVETAEINAAGKQPQVMKELQVEFGIWQTKNGAHKAYNVTLPGGVPLTRENLENRTAIAGRTFRGSIVLWSWRQGWGFIQVDASTPVTPQIQQKIALMNQQTKDKGKTPEHDKALYFRKTDCQQGFKPEKGTACSFQIYTDDKGAGAFEVH